LAQREWLAPRLADWLKLAPDLGDPLRDDPVAHIDQSCVACGNCGEVAEAAVLCPSFYRADVVHNAGPWETRLSSWRRRVITWLQRRRERRWLHLDDGRATRV